MSKNASSVKAVPVGNSIPTLSPQERELLRLFRECAPERRERVLSFANTTAACAWEPHDRARGAVMFKDLDEGLAHVRASATDDSLVPAALTELDEWLEALADHEPEEGTYEVFSHLMRLRERVAALPDVDPLLKCRAQLDVESRIEPLSRRLAGIAQKVGSDG